MISKSSQGELNRAIFTQPFTIDRKSVASLI